ncbi:ABC transporter permease [Legionella impletisoli]|nr:FtsX-like permease family protein [Legionella impletisoli]
MISIILGVSLFVTTRISVENIFSGFDAATSYVGNKDSVQITSETGQVPEFIIPLLLSVPEIDSVIPMSSRYLEAYAGNHRVGYIYLVGTDILAIEHFIHLDKLRRPEKDLASYLGFFLNEPVLAFMSTHLAEQSRHAPLFLRINGKNKPVIPNFVFDNTQQKSSHYGDEILIIDIKNYQNLFQSYSFIDQINLTFNTTDVQKAIDKIQHFLPKTLHIQQGNDNLYYANNITKAFRFVLNYLTSFALLVTAIIIYNAISYYVLDRRRDFGIILMLGGRAETLFFSTLLTSILLACLCTAIGVLLGYFISVITIKSVTQTISTLFLPVQVTEIHLPRTVIIEVFTVMILITGIVSVLPSREIFRIAPRQTVSYQTYEEAFKYKLKIPVAVGTVFLILSLLGLMYTYFTFNPVTGYIAFLAINISVCFFLPATMLFFLSQIRRIASYFRIEALITIDHIKATMRKHVVAVAAMSIAISLYLTATVMIDSTQYTALNWVDQVFSADLYVSDKNNVLPQFIGHYLPEGIIEEIKQVPGVKSVTLFSHKDITYQHEPLRVLSTNYETLEQNFNIQFVNSLSQEELKHLYHDATNVFISQHAAKMFHLKPGDVIELRSSNGIFKGRVANIFYNYFTFQNIVVIDHKIFKQLFHESRAEQAMISLNYPNDEKRVIDAIKQVFPYPNIVILYQQKMKETANHLFMATTGIGKGLVWAIMILTSLTLFSTIEQLILSRRRDFTIFWTIGASDFTLIKMCLWESFLICSAAVLNAIFPTVLILVLLFNFLDLILFGTDIFASFSIASLFSFTMLLCLIVLLNGIIPALKVKKLIHVDALRME